MRQTDTSNMDDFQAAIIHNRVTEVEIFINNGMDVDCRFSSGWTALMYAANCAHPDVTRCLLKHSANPNLHKDKYTTLMSACASTANDESRIFQCVLQLLDAGADVNAYDKYHMSSLMYAAREGRTTVVKKLMEKDAHRNHQDLRGYSALMWAAQRGHLSVVQILLADASIDVDKQRPDGTTALALAALNQHRLIVELLEVRTTVKQKPSLQKLPNEKSDLDNIDATVSASVAAVVPVNNVKEDVTPSTVQRKQRVTETSSGKSNCRTEGAEVASCGELELFLLGLDMRNLIPVFVSHQITFASFLQMTESDLRQLGISEVEERTQILQAIKDTHRKKHKPTTSSLVPAQYSKKISCNESVSMMNNLKKHLGFVGSSVGYISDGIFDDRQIVLDSPNPGHIRELMASTQEALDRVDELYVELVQFRTQMKELCPDHHFTSSDGDLVSFKKKASGKPKTSWKQLILIGGGALTCLAAVSWLLKVDQRI